MVRNGLQLAMRLDAGSLHVGCRCGCTLAVVWSWFRSLFVVAAMSGWWSWRAQANGGLHRSSGARRSWTASPERASPQFTFNYTNDQYTKSSPEKGRSEPEASAEDMPGAG